MSQKNQTMTVQGYNGNSELQPIDQEQPFSDCDDNKHYGMPITACAFWEMLDRFRNTATAKEETFKNLWWVQFSKASILRIIAQEQCDYIRFYFAIPDATNNKVSLMLQGIGSDLKTIKHDVLLEVAKKMEDQNNISNDQLDEMKLLKSLTKLSPATEEKGNGGHKTSFTGEKNVKSIDDFYKWQKDNGKSDLTMDLATFAKDFLEYVDK